MKSMAQIKIEQKRALLKLIEFAGSNVRLANELGYTRSAVTEWVKRGRISASAAIKAERHTNGHVTKEELRPDVTEWFNKE